MKRIDLVDSIKYDRNDYEENNENKIDTKKIKEKNNKPSIFKINDINKQYKSLKTRSKPNDYMRRL